MSAKTKTTEPAAATTDTAAPANRLLSTFAETNLPLVKAAGPLAGVPRGNAAAARRGLKELVAQQIAGLLADDLRRAEQGLEKREDVQNALAVHDYFANAPEGAGLWVLNADQPAGAVPDLLEDLGETFKFVQIAVADDADPIPDPNNPDALPVQPVDAICDAISRFGQKGVQSHVMTQIRPRPFSELVPALIKYPLLGSQPGRDSVQCFIDRVVHKEFDPNLVTAHTVLGAALGKRLWLDTNVHIAEPMDGDRNTGSGARGWLKGVQLVPAPGQTREFREEQRNTLAMHGISTSRGWSGVGDAVVVINRSLQEGGDTPYVFASTTRLRNLVQAVFHETAEHEIRGAGQRTAGPLEATSGLMNVFLNRLTTEGWLTEGSVTVDYESLTVTIKVRFKPVNPIDSILIEWTH